MQPKVRQPKLGTRWRSGYGAGQAQRKAQEWKTKTLQSHAQAIAAKHNKPHAIARAHAMLASRAQQLADEAERRDQQSQDRERWHAAAARMDQNARELRRYGSLTRRVLDQAR